MSLPSTGSCKVETSLGPCTFNGSTWESPNASLAKRLNHHMEHVPTHHYSIESIAKNCLDSACLTGKITDVVQDEWTGEDAHINGVD